MDLKKLLESVENKDEIIKQIETEIGKDYVPRAEFNVKNTELKELTTKFDDLKTSNDNFTIKVSDYDKTIADLTSKVSSSELASLKTKIAYQKGIPYELATRLAGDDEATILQDAESLSKLIDKKQALPPLKSTETDVDNGDASYKTLLSNLRGE